MRLQKINRFTVLISTSYSRRCNTKFYKHIQPDRREKKTYKEVKHACVSFVSQAMVKFPDGQQMVKQQSIKTF